MERLADLEDEEWVAAPGLGKGAKAIPVTSPFDTRLTVGTVRYATPPDVDAMVRAAAAAQPAWDALGGEERARLLDRAADLFEDHRDALFSLCVREAGKTRPRRHPRSARGGRFPALLRLRSTAAVRRAGSAPRPDGGDQPAPPPRPRGVRLHFAVEFPARDFHRAGRRRAGRGQCRDRQARRADPADRRARARPDARGGDPPRHRPARPRRGRRPAPR